MAKKKEESNIEKAEKAVEGVVEKVAEGAKKVTEEVEERLSGKGVEEDVENIEKEAEKESLETEKSAKKKDVSEDKEKTSEEDVEQKKKALLEKAAKLKEKVSSGSPTTEELKEQVKAKKRAEMLLPLDEYVKAGIYLGTRVVTPDMRPFVYRRRADGLAIFNTDLIDEKLKEGIEYLSKFDPKDVILVCKREAGWKAARMFSEITGIRVFTKKYPAGILTNVQLENFIENELTIVTDHWLDKNALRDTLNVNKKVLMVCDTNNFSREASQVIIGNNKSPRSLGLIFYLLTRGYAKAKGISTAKIPELEWWTGEKEDEELSKKLKKKKVGAKLGV